jgi:ribosome-associated heat shock protein Hsp15
LRRRRRGPERARGLTEAHRQRLDKWLWFARVVKTRTLAASLVADGCVRVNQQRAEAASKAVKPGDVLTIALERQVRVLKVLAPGASRRPYEEAKMLYEDLSPPPAPKPIEAASAGARDRGTGRPTGRQRRKLDRFLSEDEGA